MTPASNQAHFTVGNGAVFQMVGITLTGVKNANGGGITVNAPQSQLGIDDTIVSGITSGPAINIQSALKVHIRYDQYLSEGGQASLSPKTGVDEPLPCVSPGIASLPTTLPAMGEPYLLTWLQT